MSAGEADVRLDKVRKTFGPVVAVNDVTLDIGRGEYVSVSTQRDSERALLRQDDDAAPDRRVRATERR